MLLAVKLLVLMVLTEHSMPNTKYAGRPDTKQAAFT